MNIIDRQVKKTIQENGATLIKVNMRYPELTEGNAEDIKRANRCIRQMAEAGANAAVVALYEEARSAWMMLGAAFPGFEVTMRYVVTYQQGGLFSLFSDVFLGAGGLSGSTYRYGWTWLLKEAHPMFITALFPKNAPIRNIVTGFVSSIHQYPRWADAINTYYSSENFYLTDRGLAVFYQPHTIAPGASGVRTFVLPYGESGLIQPEQIGINR